jgi:hypothetical protein
MESKKINQLATEMTPTGSDLTIIGDPITGVSKKITLLQLSTTIGAGADLQGVTDNGATTTNPIAIGGLTITGLATGVLKSDSGVISSVPFGAANGVATLGGDGKVPSSQLPSYVDDVVEVANFAALPAIGETGKIYITLDNNKVYRWTGSTYVEIAANYAVWGAITGTLSNQTDLQNALNAKQNTITLTTTGTSGASTLVGSTLNIPNYSTDLSGYVPYTGATANVNLGTFDLTADVITGATGSFASSGGSDTFAINHSSGSGIALNITKGGNGEGLYINKTSGSGNAATIIGTLNATTLVKSGGTSSQFLKADGSIDSSTYLTTGSAASTYLPLSGGIMTGQIVLKEGTTSSDYTKGLKFPNDPYGGSGDTSGLRLYADTSTGIEAQVLELYVTNDATPSVSVDKINFAAPNNDLVTVNYNKIWNVGNLPSPQSAITLTTTGSSGAATFVSNTLNIPQYQAALTNPITGTGTRTINYLPLFSGSTNSIENSSVYEVFTPEENIGVYVANTLKVQNALSVTGNISGNYITAYHINVTDTGIPSNGMYRSAANTLAFSTNSALKMTITSDGNVGIGTNSPNNALLDVAAGGYESTQTVAINIGANIGVTSTRSSNTRKIGNITGQHYNNTDRISLLRYDSNVSDTSLKIGGTDELKGATIIEFATATSTTATPNVRMTITSGGAVCIGTGSTIVGANAILHVNSSDAGPTFKNANSAQQGLEIWSAVSSGDNLFVEFSVNTSISAKGSIDYNRGSNVTRYNTTSDANLKNIIGDSNKQKSIDILNTTKIKEYSWKDDETNKVQIGVIAQELYETYKGAVSVGSDESLLGTEEYKSWKVDKTAFTFHLIAGWQKHEQKINDLQAQIEELKALINK